MNLDPLSAVGKGFIGEMIIAKYLGLKNCNILSLKKNDWPKIRRAKFEWIEKYRVDGNIFNIS